MQNSLTEKWGLSKSILQLIAVIAMVVDHVSIFVTSPLLYFIMRGIGKLGIIVMCYFVAEGFYKTKNVGRYIIRMAVFAAISQIPYYLYRYWGAIPQNFNAIIVSMFYSRNVIFTLFLGLCLLAVLKSEYNLGVKVLAMLATLMLAENSDWGYYAVLWIIGFGMFYGDKKKQMIWLSAILLLRIVFLATVLGISVINTKRLLYFDLYTVISYLGGFGALFLLPLYNGEKGRMPKWTFYVFYPVHLLILTVIIAVVF